MLILKVKVKELEQLLFILSIKGIQTFEFYLYFQFKESPPPLNNPIPTLAPAPLLGDTSGFETIGV